MQRGSASSKSRPGIPERLQKALGARRLLVGRAGGILDRGTHRLGDGFNLALDADHLGRLVGGVEVMVTLLLIGPTRFVSYLT